MSKKEMDLDEEIRKIARKSNVRMKKSEYSFESRIKKLDKEMDNLMDSKIKEFDENKKLASDYFETDFGSLTIDRYREKLKKI